MLDSNMYAAMLLLTVVGACHCEVGRSCVETGQGEGCCGYEAGVGCGRETCCPSGTICTPDGNLCEGNGTFRPSRPIYASSLGNCMQADSRFKAAVQAAVAAPSYTSFLAAIDLYSQGKAICSQRTKLTFTPGSCMVDFLLLETDSRVTYWNLAKGDVKSAFSSLLNVLIWLPYLNADCLA